MLKDLQGARHATSEEAVRLNGVRHCFANGTAAPLEVLHDITLGIERGQVQAVVGPSGSGKTTLLNIIAGRIVPSGGTVTCNLNSSRSSGDHRHLGMVFQEPALLPWRNITENVRLPLELTGRMEGSEAQISPLIELVNLDKFAAYYPRQLSGGMRSRAAIARALVTSPELVLFDEPFGNLDELTSQELMVQVSNLLHRSGASACVVAHNLDQAVFMADRVVVLSQRPGTIIGVVEIDHPKPRSLDFLESASFFEKLTEVRKLLRAAVCRS
jgi:NitT/TauT family transport system ATP-binding protein